MPLRYLLWLEAFNPVLSPWKLSIFSVSILFFSSTEHCAVCHLVLYIIDDFSLLNWWHRPNISKLFYSLFLIFWILCLITFLRLNWWHTGQRPRGVAPTPWLSQVLRCHLCPGFLFAICKFALWCLSQIQIQMKSLSRFFLCHLQVCIVHFNKWKLVYNQVEEYMVLIAGLFVFNWFSLYSITIFCIQLKFPAQEGLSELSDVPREGGKTKTSFAQHGGSGLDQFHINFSNVFFQWICIEIHHMSCVSAGLDRGKTLHQKSSKDSLINILLKAVQRLSLRPLVLF